jgi:hypothetical protein
MTLQIPLYADHLHQNVILCEQCVYLFLLWALPEAHGGSLVVELIIFV